MTRAWLKLCGSLVVLAILFVAPAVHARCVSAAGNNLLLCPDHGGDGSAWGLGNCAMCHAQSVIHKGGAARHIRDIVARKGAGTCTGCHGSNGTGATRRCQICHNAVDLPVKPIRQGTRVHDFSVAKARKMKEAHCASCHQNSDMDGRFEPAIDLTAYKNAQGVRARPQTISAFCVSCHNRDHQQRGYKMHVRPDRGLRDPLVASADNYFGCDTGSLGIDWHGCKPGAADGQYSGLRDTDGDPLTHEYQYGTDDPAPVECTDCHAMHGTHNAKLIIPSARVGVTGMNRAFRFDPTHTVTVDGKNYAQLCVLCHQMPVVQPSKEQEACDTGNGLSGVHNAGLNADAACGSGYVQGGADCEECHQHGGSATIGPGL